MIAGQHLPLGQPIPDSPHAVSVSMPTMADVISYEEKLPKTLERLTSGYPRFIVHPHLRSILSHWQSLFDTPDCSYWLTSSEAMANRLQAYLAPEPSKFIKHRGVSGIRIRNEADINLRAKQYLQHVGGFLSSRQAEDYLVAEGVLPGVHIEPSFPGDAKTEVIDCLQPLFGTDRESIALSITGMNAFFAAFEAVRSLQSGKGRRSWVKIGWLYTDTMQILDKLSGAGAENIELFDVFDIDSLEAILQDRGSEVAGIVTEAPTNPLIQTMDLERIRELATKHGAYLIVDPTVASLASIDVTPIADIVVNSLTKYAASEGDVILGAVATTPSCPNREAIKAAIAANIEAPYARDLARLAYQVSEYVPLVHRLSATAKEVASFLTQHSKVRKVYWTHEPRSLANYRKIARSPDAVGPLLSFEFDGPVERFYDAVPLAKGPSFGMKSTLLCPYIYLAHYALVSSEEGRKTLASAGIAPELIRLSVGAEPIEEILSALKAGLES